MGDLSRIGVAIESDLLDDFDRLIERRNYPSRSEAFRDLIRDALMAETVQADKAPVVGSVTLVYDHHVPQLTARLTALQHAYHHLVVSTQHVHLDSDDCLEVIVVRGTAGEVRQLADRLISTKGVRHGRLTIAESTASLLKRTDRFGRSQPHRHGGPAHSHAR